MSSLSTQLGILQTSNSELATTVSELTAAVIAQNSELKASNDLIAVDNQAIKNQITGLPDEVFEQVDSVLPERIDERMELHLYLDVANGNDSNPGTASAPFKTLKALIDSAPMGSVIIIFGPLGQRIDVNERIQISNKKVVCRLIGATLNLNAILEVYGSLLRFSYPLIAVNLSVPKGISHYSGDIRLNCTKLVPATGSEALFLQVYTGGDVSGPGSHHSNILFTGEVDGANATADSPFYVFAPTYYMSSMIVTTHNITLGANTNLFHPTYQTLQVGTKGVYLVGS
ncbi:hypothetical protein L1286_03230 [Pseudoalteromonas sp. SMS1]|uniref:hypothetical protein n=1 Tax=Pseudoalteromonas sp. SMS1 TaxID=2908894 RepID=UPI001F455A9A|nr:hypothetical protein [Pseudoalteromonas sp. SMS1]MCF2856472.1 hypothetical protein [Pseudoalteromonas sp. SMS1]